MNKLFILFNIFLYITLINMNMNWIIINLLNVYFNNQNQFNHNVTVSWTIMVC